MGLASDVELVVKGRMCEQGCFGGVQSWSNCRYSVSTGLTSASDKGFCMVMIVEKGTSFAGF